MPSDDLLLYFQEDFSLSQKWRVSGQHYSRTSTAWLKALDESWANNGELKEVLGKAYGKGNELR